MLVQPLDMVQRTAGLVWHLQTPPAFSMLTCHPLRVPKRNRSRWGRARG